jgi:hypothetical protein
VPCFAPSRAGITLENSNQKRSSSAVQTNQLPSVGSGCRRPMRGATNLAA